MEDWKGKELRFYGFGSYEHLVNWLFFMIFCTELLLFKYLFIFGGIHTDFYELIIAFIIIPLFLLWLLLIKNGKLKYLVIKEKNLCYKTAFGRWKECSWKEVDKVNIVGLNINIWLSPHKKFVGMNKYIRDVEIIEKIYQDVKQRK